MKLIIRDDDTSYFTKPSHLEKIYQKIRDKTTIHIAVIPYVYVHQKQTPFMGSYKRNNFWIWENKELIDFLNEKIKEKKVKILQHWLTHKDIIQGKKFELESKNYKAIYDSLKKWKKHLESIFDQKIDTLVAPHNRFSRQSIVAAENLQIKYINRWFAPLPREFRFKKKYFHNFIKLSRFILKHWTKYVYPHTLDFGKHTEVFSYYMTKINKHNINKILSLHKEWTLCLSTHYRSFSLVDEEKINYILDRSINNNHSK